MRFSSFIPDLYQLKCLFLLLLMFGFTVVGEKEVENNTVNVRTRDNKVHGEHTLEHVISRFNHFKTTFVLDAQETF